MLKNEKVILFEMKFMLVIPIILSTYNHQVICPEFRHKNVYIKAVKGHSCF